MSRYEKRNECRTAVWWGNLIYDHNHAYIISVWDDADTRNSNRPPTLAVILNVHPGLILFQLMHDGIVACNGSQQTYYSTFWQQWRKTKFARFWVHRRPNIGVFISLVWKRWIVQQAYLWKRPPGETMKEVEPQRRREVEQNGYEKD